jgi:hypothetical protein
MARPFLDAGVQRLIVELSASATSEAMLVPLVGRR